MPPPEPESILANDFRALWNEVRDEALAAVDRVGKSGWWILGQEVEAFECALADCWGMRHAVGTANGMDALEIALRAGGLRPGEKVLTTPLSAFASTLAILRAGGCPVFVDVDSTGLIDLDLAREAFASDPTLRWFLPVHLYGQCLNLAHLQEIGETFGVRIVEDCAQSIGAKWNGRSCGTVGMAAATSFYPTKNLGAMGDGGALLTNDPELAATARQLRDYGQSAKYEHSLPGLNSRLDEVQAAVLREAFLPRLAKFTARRKSIADFFNRELHHESISPCGRPFGSEGVFHLYPVVVAEARADFLAHLRTHRIHAGIHYPSLITSQPALRGSNLVILGTLDRAAFLAQREVSLPVHPHLSDSQVEAIVAACFLWRPESP